MYVMQFVQHYYQVHNQTFIGWAEKMLYLLYEHRLAAFGLVT